MVSAATALAASVKFDTGSAPVADVSRTHVTVTLPTDGSIAPAAVGSWLSGVANLAALSITQTVAQLRAPREKRGQVIGLYSTGANGMRIGSGFTVGLFGVVVGLRPALALSAATLCACVLLLAVYLAVVARRGSRAEASRAIA